MKLRRSWLTRTVRVPRKLDVASAPKTWPTAQRLVPERRPARRRSLSGWSVGIG
jgi:hypothetical protein